MTPPNCPSPSGECPLSYTKEIDGLSQLDLNYLEYDADDDSDGGSESETDSGSTACAVNCYDTDDDEPMALTRFKSGAHERGRSSGKEARKEESPEIESPQRVMSNEEYTLSDGTIVRGTRGVTFAGFYYLPGCIDKNAPESGPASPAAAQPPEVTLPENPISPTSYKLPELTTNVASNDLLRASAAVRDIARCGTKKRARLPDAPRDGKKPRRGGDYQEKLERLRESESKENGGAFRQIKGEAARMQGPEDMKCFIRERIKELRKQANRSTD
ncbi:hypothetical protein NPX13_g10508 [Xylaria arbuscula]|uniref:Uncharacterized protein n=1 Tax=Xylaria arbuscula TaxID=114810 RepID=A0A9W8N4N6_9PEZI|nr:hypothetical protein NPX13_g10508 [Xylaria arbuscula]